MTNSRNSFLFAKTPAWVKNGTNYLFDVNPKTTMVFLKMYLLKTGWDPTFLWLNIIISHIFPENFIYIPHVVQKIWRLSLSLSILAIFIDFLNFLLFPSYKETNDISLWQIMSAFFHFQHTLNRLFNNCIKLYWY